jgi:predicted DNA-binding antitoxin AbrB/MazE fold protein
MEKRLEAIYAGGVLRPIEPLDLPENQRLTLTIDDEPSLEEELAGLYTPEEIAAAKIDTITVAEVRKALSGIEGSLADAVIALRNEP